MPTYRPLPESDRDVFHEYVQYAFSPEDGPAEYDPEDHETPRASLGDRRGLYPDEGGEADADPLCVCRHLWFDARVRGEVYPVAGLSAVATPPAHRRGGRVATLLERSLEEYRERGARFSVLWPFRYAFYRRYGWDTCNRERRYEWEVEALSFAADAVDGGAYRRVPADEYERLVDVYERHAARYDLSLEREEEWWRHRVLGGRDEDPFAYAWERDGALRGYLVYDVEGSDGEDRLDRTMRVTELAFVDHEALLALLAFCFNHDSQVRRVELYGPPDLTLLDLAPEPEDVDCEVRTGAMGRIVDVAETLAALPYPDVDASVRLAVDDPVVTRNDGTFALEVSGGTASCEPADGEADARLDVGALSQLAVGYRTAAALERTGRLDATPSAADALDRLFPATSPYLGDRF